MHRSHELPRSAQVQLRGAGVCRALRSATALSKQPGTGYPTCKRFAVAALGWQFLSGQAPSEPRSCSRPTRV